MDLLTEGRITKINELAEIMLADSRRRARAVEPDPFKSAFLDLSRADVERYSIAAAVGRLCGLGVAGKRAGGFEQECSDALGRRFEIPLGSIAIPTDVLYRRTMSSKYAVGVSAPAALSFIDYLRNTSIVHRLGARQLTDLKDDVAIPRQTTGNVVTWLGPGGSTTASGQAFGQVSATPKTACIVSDVSEQLLRQSSADEIITRVLALDMAVGVDTVVINGAGGVEPLGILNTPGVGATSGSTVAYSGVVGMQKTVADANAVVDPLSAGYVTTPTVAELLKGRQRFTSTDSPLWRGAVHEGEIEGVKAIASKSVPASTMLYGDWSSLVVGQWGPLLLSANASGTRFNQVLVGIRALWMIDVFVTAPTAFVKMTSIT